MDRDARDGPTGPKSIAPVGKQRTHAVLLVKN